MRQEKFYTMEEVTYERYLEIVDILRNVTNTLHHLVLKVADLEKTVNELAGKKMEESDDLS